MCLDTPGVPPLLPADRRGANDRIPPEELTPLGGGSVGWVGVPAARPADGAAAPPVVVLCHERYGVVQHTVDLGRRLAERGHVVVAPDFYAGMHLTGEEERLPDVPDTDVLRHLDAAVAHAHTLPGAAASPVAVIGVCRSGSYGILASASRSGVAAVVMLYGGAQQREHETGALRSTPYPELLAGSTAPVLGIWGERDHTMSVEDVRRVRDLLEDARRSYDFTVYAGMPHGWLNDTMPGRSRPAEAEAAFEQIVQWLADVLHGPPATAVTWRFRSEIAPDYDFTTNERLH